MNIRICIVRRIKNGACDISFKVISIMACPKKHDKDEAFLGSLTKGEQVVIASNQVKKCLILPSKAIKKSLFSFAPIVTYQEYNKS